MKKRIVALFTIAVFFLCLAATANIPRMRIVSEKLTNVTNPEVSRVFYGELKGSADIFKVESKEPFDLYVNASVPNIEGARKDILVEIYTGENLPGQEKTGDGTMQIKRAIALLDGKTAAWQGYSRSLSGEKLLQGPEYKDNKDDQPLKSVRMEPGMYFIQILNGDNEGKYALAIGTKNEFAVEEAVNTLKLLPKINMEFFGKSPISAFFNLTGLFILSFVAMLAILATSIKKILPRRKKRVKGEEKIGDEEEIEEKEESKEAEKVETV